MRAGKKMKTRNGMKKVIQMNTSTESTKTRRIAMTTERCTRTSARKRKPLVTRSQKPKRTKAHFARSSGVTWTSQ